MTIDNLVNHFHGLPVEDFDPAVGLVHPTAVAYRVRIDDYIEDAEPVVACLSALFADPAAAQLRALLIGCWGASSENESVISALVNGARALPALEALFLGDITFEECEMSWIQQGDVTPLLTAFPRLRALRVRGSDGLVVRPVSHASLELLAFESGGLPDRVISGVLGLRLPALKHLELWLGTDEYGRDGNSAALDPLLHGGLFPGLRHLALRNVNDSDRFMARLAASPLLARIDELDISMGDLGDAGIRLLAASPHLRPSLIVDVSHHYARDLRPLAARVAQIKQDPSDPLTMEDGERYIAVSE